VSIDLSRDLLEEKITMSSAYMRNWELGETREEHIGNM
jgi:hypothetical protein